MVHTNIRLSADNADVEIEESTLNEGGTWDEQSTTQGRSQADDSNTLPEIGRSEGRAIWGLRLLIFALLILASIAASASVFVLAKRHQYNAFVAQFRGTVPTIKKSFQDIVEQKFQTIYSLGVTATAYAHSHNSEWPFVTMNDFQERAATVRQLSGALFIRFVSIVSEDDREEWEKYSVGNLDWLNKAKAEQTLHFSRRLQQEEQQVDFSSGVGDKIYEFGANGAVADRGSGPYYPLWQESPTFGQDLINWNAARYDPYREFLLKTAQSGQMTLGGIQTSDPGDSYHDDITTRYFARLKSVAAGKEVEYKGDPMSTVFVPVFHQYNKTGGPAAILFAVFGWGSYFENALSPDFPGVIIVLENTCDGPFTYKISGSEVKYLGQGDIHRKEFDSLVDKWEMANMTVVDNLGSFNEDVCAYSLRVYPTKELFDKYNTSLPGILVVVAALVSAYACYLFLLYNRYVDQRQSLVLNQAQQSTAIVSSLFPEGVRDRLMEDRNQMHLQSGKSRLKTFLNDGDDEPDTKPIADLFPHTTVCFADISGFTAWSSTRDPTQVFVLLQTIYQAFDAIAKRRRVFKIETIGDTYLAVSGLPERDDKHFVTMAKFACDCLEKFGELTKKLEESLGPDTCDLGLRVGLHSSGEANKIQVSATTASLLAGCGMQSWLKTRGDTVVAKGIGIVETYWLMKPIESHIGSEQELSEPDRVAGTTELKEGKQARLVNWIVDVLLGHVRKVMARNQALGLQPDAPETLVYHLPQGKTSLDEVVEVVELPDFNDATASMESVVISSHVVGQLHEVVATIANGYCDNNNFHNFEHACHVTMCCEKFLARIVSPDIDDGEIENQELPSKVHAYTHGITSDPLSLLALTFSSLIHDMDHRGVSNAQLCKEDPRLATAYSYKSVAEQNSLDLAWDILMSDKFVLLRSAVFSTKHELLRFRQILVNMVLCTDIFDRELNDLRKLRWSKAFGENQNNNNLRATIVLEHIMQASDVSHTKMYTAFKQNRMEKNPADFWYEGEIGFFDNYVIPLAKKLKDCNVFQASSDECLNFAVQNRLEWEKRGKDVVASLIAQTGVMPIAPYSPPSQREEVPTQCIQSGFEI